MYQIGCKFVRVAGKPYVTMRLNELTNVLELSLSRLQRHCQTTLANALSHERVTPLNKILGFSRSMLREDKLDIEKLKEKAH